MSYALVRGAPARLIGCALALFVAYGIAHLAGLRDAVSVLSTGSSKGAAEGIFYATSYFAAMLLAPPLVLAAALIAGSRALQAALTARRRARSTRPAELA